jgi:hypothetical protein
MEYIIQAHSPSLGYSLRELQLEGPAITRRDLAGLFADSFARRLNERQHMGVADWQPRIDTIDPTFHARTL